jgi:hypothetical protein
MLNQLKFILLQVHLVAVNTTVRKQNYHSRRNLGRVWQGLQFGNFACTMDTIKSNRAVELLLCGVLRAEWLHTVPYLS